MTDRDRAEHVAPAGPDPDAVDALQCLVDSPLDEPLPAGVQQWLRAGMLAAVYGGDALVEALGLKGTNGRACGIGEVRERLRARALREAADLLALDECPTARARKILAALRRIEMGDTSDGPHVGRLLRHADALGRIPRSTRGLAPLLPDGSETLVSLPDQRTAPAIRDNIADT